MTEVVETGWEIPEGCEEVGQIVMGVINKIYNRLGETPNTGGCKSFYHPEEWLELGHEYGVSRNAALVLVHDGGDLAEFCDWSRQNYKWIEKLQEALDARGYIMEQCTCWHSAVYHKKDPVSKTHWLKTWPEQFTAIAQGRKRFELRRADRDFRAGDKLLLKEYDPETEEYTGAAVLVPVTYILRDADKWGLDDEFCVMSLGDVEDFKEASQN